MGLSGELPDRAVPGPLKSAQLALAAPAESNRRGVGDFLSADSQPGDYLVPGGPMVGAMIRKQIGGLVNDPVRTGMEMTGYPAARRSMDAGRLALESEDPIEGAGRATRALGEGGLALAQVAGNAYGIGSNVTKLYRGKTPVAPLPDADMAAVQSRAAKAQTAGPTQLQEMIDDAGARADAAYAKIKPVNYPKAQPARAARRQRRKPQDAYTPYEISPEDQALLAQRAQYLKQNAAEDDQILRLALAAEDEAPDVAAAAAKEGQGVTLSANGAQWGAPRTRPIRDYVIERVDKEPIEAIAKGAGKKANSVRVMLSRERGRINERLANKETVEALAQDYGVSKDVMVEFLKPMKPGRKPEMTDQIRALAKEPLDGRLRTNEEIADALYKKGFKNVTPWDVATIKTRLRRRGEDIPLGQKGRPRKSVVETGRNLALPLGMTYLQGRAAQETMRDNGYQMGLQ